MQLNKSNDLSVEHSPDIFHLFSISFVCRGFPWCGFFFFFLLYFELNTIFVTIEKQKKRDFDFFLFFSLTRSILKFYRTELFGLKMLFTIFKKSTRASNNTEKVTQAYGKLTKATKKNLIASKLALVFRIMSIYIQRIPLCLFGSLTYVGVYLFFLHFSRMHNLCSQMQNEMIDTVRMDFIIGYKLRITF